MNSLTFSTMMTAGLTILAHFGTTHASARTLLLTGADPFAREKWRQSGEATSRSTGNPRVTSSGFWCQTSPRMCRAFG